MFHKLFVDIERNETFSNWTTVSIKSARPITSVVPGYESKAGKIIFLVLQCISHGTTKNST